MKNFEEYKSFVSELIYHFNPIRQDQLVLALKNYFNDIDDKAALEILDKCQTKRVILLSEDGWALTRGKYVQLTGDDRYKYMNTDKEHMLPRLTNVIQEQCNMKLINCLWILIDMLPASMDFALTHKPFQISFISSKKELYEVIYIQKDEEDAKLEMLKNLPSDLFDIAKKTIKRVVILENEQHAFKVPHGKGIRFVLALDHTRENHYRIIEKREKPWDEQQEV